MPEFYPPVGFYFSVNFSGVKNSLDSSFKEVSGLSFSVKTEEYEASGENRFRYRFPTALEYTNVKLSRGLVPSGSQLAAWLLGMTQGDGSLIVTPKDIVISLLNKDNQPLISWSFVDAFPVKWELSSLNSMNNELAIETLELTYKYFYKL